MNAVKAAANRAAAPRTQVWDLQRGNMDGSVSGRKVGNSDVPNAANDGGFGSIPQALFQAIPGTASGALAQQLPQP